jgi:hypothetical protein
MLTARVPELAAPDLALHIDDLLIVHQSGNNKTVQRKLSDISAFVMSGGGVTPLTPTAVGNSIFVTVGAAEAGTQTMSIPSLAGQAFVLRRRGLGALNPSEYTILSGGGFTLNGAGDLLDLGESFELELYSTLPGSIIPGVIPSAGGGFIDGYLNIPANTVLNNTSNINKLLQVRANATAITITLPDINNVPDNTIFPIETNITNTVQCQIVTTGGQFIYMNNQSRTSVHMGIGESLWLYRGDTGYFVINDFARIYRELAKPQPAFKVDVNELLLDGSLLPRASYPRLWEVVQTFGASLVSDAVWNTASEVLLGRTIPRPYRGCFSTGDGSTTFRIPDFMNMAVRGVKSASGGDIERLLNKPGGYQDESIKYPGSDIFFVKRRTAAGGPIEGFRGANNAPGSDNYDEAVWPHPNIPETRMENIGVFWVIKY